MRSASHEETLSHRWGPGVLTALPMLLAYVGAAMLAPGLYSTAPRFLLTLSVLSIVVSLIVGLIGRMAGLYAPDALGQPRFDPARQGTCSAQLALLLSWPILSSLDIHQSLWAYVLAFLLVGMLGRSVFSLIGQGRNSTSGTTSGIALRQTTLGAPRLERAQVAPRWLRTTARVCFIFGLLALARLAIDREIMFLWLSLGLLAFALIAPSLAVALGFGRDEDTSR